MSTRITRQAPDMTQVVPSAREMAQVFTQSHLPVGNEKAIDSGLAMQLGVFEVLAAMRGYSVDVEALLAGQNEFSRMKMEHIYLDWATQESDLDAIPAVGVQVFGPQVYDAAGLSLGLLEETEDIYGVGTILKLVSHATATIRLISWFTHKDDRGGWKKAFEDYFLDDLEDERGGRRVVVRAYYDRVVRFILDTITYPDDAENAQTNVWILQAALKADVDVVKLVRSPGALLTIDRSLEIGTDIEVET